MKLLKLPICLAAFALMAGAQDQRSLALLFDLNSMSAPDQLRAQASAIKFVEEQMTPSTLVTIMTFTTEIKVVQDFSGDRDVLTATLRRIIPSATATAPAVASNTQLQALQNAAAMLTPIAGKKALMYFSNGIPRSATDNPDNRDQLKATIDAAVRANLAIYPVDARGLN
jgi:VWFA-related protein